MDVVTMIKPEQLEKDISSPTVSIYVLFPSCAINATEGREVITCDIPGAFL